MEVLSSGWLGGVPAVGWGMSQRQFSGVRARVIRHILMID